MYCHHYAKEAQGSASGLVGNGVTPLGFLKCHIRAKITHFRAHLHSKWSIYMDHLYDPLLLHLVWHVTVNKLAGDICHFCIKISPFLYVLQTIQTNIRIINNKFEYLVV